MFNMNHNGHFLSHESGLSVFNLLLLSEFYEKCPEYAVFLIDISLIPRNFERQTALHAMTENLPYLTMNYKWFKQNHWRNNLQAFASALFEN